MNISTRESCPQAILIALNEKPLGFEQIVENIPYSRGTVNKYLDELYQAGEVTRKRRRGVYSLTHQGRKKATTLSTKKVLNELPYPILEHILFKYKLMVTQRIHEYWDNEYLMMEQSLT